MRLAPLAAKRAYSTPRTGQASGPARLGSETFTLLTGGTGSAGGGGVAPVPADAGTGGPPCAGDGEGTRPAAAAARASASSRATSRASCAPGGTTFFTALAPGMTSTCPTCSEPGSRTSLAAASASAGRP